MKTNLNLNGHNHGRAVNGVAESTPRAAEPEALAGNGVRKNFRRLKWNELVRHGDFVVNGDGRLEPWEGPNGFRADAYVKPICRRQERRPNEAKKAV